MKSGKQSSTISDYLKKELNQIDLCFGCKRSKRPSLDQVLENIVSIEKLEVKSFESNALQLFVERVLNWQERHKKMVESNELKEIHNLMKKLISTRSGQTDSTESIEKLKENIKQLYNEIPSLKRVELNEFYIESLLLEIDLDEIKLLNELFNIVNEDEDTSFCDVSINRLEKSENFCNLTGDSNVQTNDSDEEAINSDSESNAISKSNAATKTKQTSSKSKNKKDLVIRTNLKSLKLNSIKSNSIKANGKLNKSTSNASVTKKLNSNRTESNSDFDNNTSVTKKKPTAQSKTKKSKISVKNSSN